VTKREYVVESIIRILFALFYVISLTLLWYVGYMVIKQLTGSNIMILLLIPLYMYIIFKCSQMELKLEYDEIVHKLVK